MIAHEAATYPARKSATTPRGRAAVVALWVMQIALAAMFLMAGGSKLAGVPAMIAMFDGIGIGQWFRYITGLIEVTAAIALLLPAAARFGAMLLIPTMLGAIAAHVFIIGGSPVIPIVLLVGAVAVAWGRRNRARTVIHA
jgi:putative oxidoreductase